MQKSTRTFLRQHLFMTMCQELVTRVDKMAQAKPADPAWMKGIETEILTKEGHWNYMQYDVQNKSLVPMTQKPIQIRASFRGSGSGSFWSSWNLFNANPQARSSESLPHLGVAESWECLLCERQCLGLHLGKHPESDTRMAWIQLQWRGHPGSFDSWRPS